MTAYQISTSINALPQRNKSGSLRMFGDWFGRPMDNVHKLVKAASVADCLVLGFDQGETLRVWKPTGYSTEGYTIRIADADHLRWEWYYYGREQRPENLLFHDYLKEDGQIVVSRSYGCDNPGASLDAPALEIIGM